MSAVVSKRYNSIDIFRLVCAVLIVSIHTHPLSEVSSFADHLISGIIARFAVPFFLVVSGYFYFDKLNNAGPKAVFPFLKKIIIIYSIWSIPYLLLELAAHYNEQPVWNILSKFMIDFLFFGSRYHFWYFPALIYSVIIITLLFIIFRKKHFPYIIISIALFIIGCLMSCYTEWGNHIPLIQQMNAYEKFYVIRRIFFTGLPFLMLGAVIRGYSKTVFAVKKYRAFIMLAVASALYLTEMLVLYLVFNVEEVICFSLYPLVAMILIVLLQHPLKTKNKLGYNSRLLANFMYYTHPLFIFIIQRISKMMGHEIESGTIMFFLVVALCVIIGYLLIKTPIKKIIA